MENNTQEKKTRPIILEIEDTRQELVKVVNDAIRERGIPCYFLKDILTRITEEVSAVAKQELETARASETEEKK